MAQDKISMKFTDSVVFNENANNGLGEHQARFVIVRPGEEQKAESLMQAFKSVGGKNLHERGGVVLLSEKNMAFRIAQLGSRPEHAQTVSELKRGLEKVKVSVAEAKAGAPKVATPKQRHAGLNG